MINSHGDKREETIAFSSDADIRQHFYLQGWFVMDVVEVNINSKVKKIKSKELMVFCQQSSAMINAGVHIDKTMNVIRSKTENKKIKEVYRMTYESLLKGNSLSTAMREQNGAFPEILINSISAGEESGKVGEVLTDMSIYYEKDSKMKQKIQTAMVYPIVLMVVSVLVTLMLMTFVVPEMLAMVPEDKIAGPTLMLMNISNFLTGYWYIMLFGFIFLIYGFIQRLKNRDFKVKFDKFKLEVPVVGKLLKLIYSGRIARSFASLYASGLEVDKIIRETGKSTGNLYIEDQFRELQISFTKGEGLSSGMEKMDFIDSLLPVMMAIGDETGSHETVLMDISRYYDSVSEEATLKLVGLLEPMMIIILGFVVGFIVISIFMALLSMYDSI